MSRFEKRQPGTSKGVGPRTPEAMDQVTAAMIGLDEIAATFERKWGVGRLVRLCRDNARLSFRRGWQRWHDAGLRGDVQTMLQVIEGMKQLWRIADAQATEDGHAPLSPDVWEVRCDDGTVLAICRTNAEAIAAQREGRATVAYDLTEVARLLRRVEIVDAIKREFPGATVGKTVQLDETYAESWVRADALHEVLHGELAVEEVGDE